MSRHSISRSAKREKQKTLRALIALGLTSSAFAAVAATLVWAWSPNGGNWTLSPQQDFAESGKIPAAGKGHAWVPPEVPPVTPWATIPTSADTSVAGNQIFGETTQIASVDTKDGDSSGHGPIDWGNQNEGGGNVDHTLGLFSSGGNGNPNSGGGQGGSWNGTLNPNTSGFRPLSGAFPSLTTPGNGGDGDVCKGPNAQNFEKCKTTTPTVAGIKKDDGDGNQNNNQNNNDNNDDNGQNDNNQSNNNQNNNNQNNNNNNQEDPTEQIIVGDDSPNHPAAPQQLVAVPEPGSLLMFSVALLGLGWFVRRRA